MKKVPSSICNGFSLTELVLTLGVGSFCLLAIVGTIPLGLQTVQQSNNQDEMVNLATKVARDINSTSAGTSPCASPCFNLTVPPPGGASTISAPQSVYLDASGAPTSGSQDPSSIYRLSVGFSPPAVGSRMATTARVMITFPARADTSAGWPTHYVAQVQTMVALDRN
jgi:uncharacterized protein (TIGR02598 family)